jgi:hypothetical protein
LTCKINKIIIILFLGLKENSFELILVGQEKWIVCEPFPKKRKKERKKIVTWPSFLTCFTKSFKIVQQMMKKRNGLNFWSRRTWS